ncbi:transcriptional regulator, TetR family [Desulfatibacillum aliphaticivorans]|uniref:Transcriptional regulator, TetR family n=1 Tax=Desulfatibacillum aliphaticivorans TaxID=218208 RepID=B8FM04_DESAL|nr:TetR/AcrR family transcriptional regulator [Desulfatibacillum aliphaticivorans]ACL05737.1 transcriptional regulator, TetR family [Desulfatibacillum aliphaticivorans]
MSDNKYGILKAAEELIAESGIAGATIAKVAKKAGVADSLVYQYFKGKEDLLFSVATERMNESLCQLDEQLEGIRDPESRLRKFIWYSLKYNDTHPGYVRTLLFECRSNKAFYSTPGYQVMRKHAAVLMDILKSGIQEGVFRKDINLYLLRECVYGLVDFEAVSKLAVGELDESIKDFDDIMTLILAMISVKQRDVNNDKEPRILKAALEVFSQKGFGKARITEIAQLAEVAEGTIYDYFKNKEDLLLSIPEKRLQAHVDALSEAFFIKPPLSKLRRFIKFHFWLYLPDRDFLQVFLLDVQLNKRFYGSKAFDLFMTYIKTLEEIIKEGQEQGDFRTDINPHVFRNMFLGAFSHMALRWVIMDKDNRFDKMKEIEQLTNLFCQAVVAA